MIAPANNTRTPDAHARAVEIVIECAALFSYGLKVLYAAAALIVACVLVTVLSD